MNFIRTENLTVSLGTPKVLIILLQVKSHKVNILFARLCGTGVRSLIQEYDNIKRWALVCSLQAPYERMQAAYDRMQLASGLEKPRVLKNFFRFLGF